MSVYAVIGQAFAGIVDHIEDDYTVETLLEEKEIFPSIVLQAAVIQETELVTFVALTKPCDAVCEDPHQGWEGKSLGHWTFDRHVTKVDTAASADIMGNMLELGLARLVKLDLTNPTVAKIARIGQCMGKIYTQEQAEEVFGTVVNHREGDFEIKVDDSIGGRIPLTRVNDDGEEEDIVDSELSESEDLY
ncbi:hypothetical protein [Carp edema virus]|nr:hypothetical protein [Carp edema virus]